MAKRKNSRKALAVALGIMGVAGLSVASASTLDITNNDANVAVGSRDFAAACDDAVNVDYEYDLATGKYTQLVISDIDADCAGLSLDWTLNTSGATDPSDTDVTVPTPTTPGDPVSITVGISNVDLTDDLDSIDIAIY